MSAAVVDINFVCTFPGMYRVCVIQCAIKQIVKKRGTKSIQFTNDNIFHNNWLKSNRFRLPVLFKQNLFEEFKLLGSIRLHTGFSIEQVKVKVD